jgi:hypothetical protein
LAYVVLVKIGNLTFVACFWARLATISVWKVTGLAAVGMVAVALIEPVFACAVVPAPGPVAGIGLPALAIIGVAYWVGRKVRRRKN